MINFEKQRVFVLAEPEPVKNKEGKVYAYQVRVSSGRKDKKTEKYVNSSWFAQFVGETALKNIKKLEKKDRIEINGGFSWESYEKDGKTEYTKTPKMLVFGWKYVDAGDKTSSTSTKKSAPANDDNDDFNFDF